MRVSSAHCSSWVHDNGGADFSTYKPATILRRLRGRMVANGDTSIDAYRHRLESDPEEYARLLSSLLIKVTEFFRDPAVFAHLQTQGPARSSSRRLVGPGSNSGCGRRAVPRARRPIRWRSAPSRRCDDGGPAVELRVFATDIDRGAVAFARRGLYAETAIQNVPTGDP